MTKKPKAETQSVEELEQIENESEAQILPEQAQVFSISKRFSKLHNLPDPTNPPMGYEPGRGYDNVYPFVKLPFLHPEDFEDNVSFGFGDAGYLDAKNKKHPLNAVYFGDNLQILRSLPSNSIDLIYIDPPFFSGRSYNQVWGDDNELRTFSDIWDGGLPTYVIWLNTRLWEMKRVLKSTGTIYVHCDWHASHYIKTEMDRIFGYENFLNEVIWEQDAGQRTTEYFPRKHDVIFYYAKNAADGYTFNWWAKEVRDEFNATALKMHFKQQDAFGPYRLYPNGKKFYQALGKMLADVWTGISSQEASSPIMSQKIGYPTQKPETLLERIISASSDSIETKVLKLGLEKYLREETKKIDGFDALPRTKKDALVHNLTNLYLLKDHREWTPKIDASSLVPDIVADFFMGGGTTLVVAQRLGRRFIGSDISRVAVSVTLDRLVSEAEQLTGRTASSRQGEKQTQGKLLEDREINDIYTYYHGIYPADKFGHLSQDSFDTFVLTCFGASKNTVADGVTGFKTQFEPVLVGPASPRDTLSVERVREFVQSVISRHIQENQRYTLTMIAWKFDPAIQEYRRQLLRGFFKKLQEQGVMLEMELIPIRSKQFRERIATTYGVPEEDKERLMQFVESPIINEIVVKKIAGKKLVYSFEALAKSLNQGGRLINCQWDFNYENGNFSDPDYALRRRAIKGNGFEADLIAEKTFDNPGSYIIACRVQDNLGGETIKTMRIEVE